MLDPRLQGTEPISSPPEDTHLVTPGRQPAPGPGSRPVAGRIDPRRYRKLRRFLARTFLHALWWDLFLRQPVLRRFRKPPIPRWQEVARRYRALAIEMGGVLIKLGQFLSIRVDLLPREITQVLAGLQDEVPPAPYEEVVAEVEADLNRSINEVFLHVSPQPVGAASLAQVHAARLPGGEEVVVKVLRPGIHVLVETDLAALSLAVRWLKIWRPIRRRVDLNRLAAEFRRTTRRELDLQAEGRHAERFAANFAHDPQVLIPKVFWAASGRRTLTLEDVAYIKIGNLQGLERAGIRRSEVAKKLYQVYMQQIFVHNFVHADPHPGNLFIRPLGPAEVGPEGRPSPEGAPAKTGRPFQIVFVDFGMVAEIPQHLRGALREYAIGLGTRDAHRVVQAYVAAGVLLPGADLRRLEEVHEELFQRFWGVRLGEMRDTALSEASYFLRHYWDVVAEAPFQVQVELLFVSRAVGLLSGMATNLDPDFDPWAETLPFAEDLAKEELWPRGKGWFEEVVNQSQILFRLPAQADRVLNLAQRGSLTVQASLAPDTRRVLQRLERAIVRLGWMVTAMGLLLAGVLLEMARPEEPWGLISLALAGGALIWGLLKRL